MHRLLVPGLFLSLLLVSCGGGGGESGEEGAAPGDANATAARSAPAEASGDREVDSVPDPCELLGDDLLRAHFDIGEAELEWRPSEHSPQPLCTVSWPKPNAAEIEARYQEVLSEYMTRKMKGEDVERPDLQTSNSVDLTINKTLYESGAAASRAFDAVVTRLEKGTTVERDEETRTMFQYDTEPVEGVADRAIWVAGLGQLTVQSGRRIFHVGVHVYDDPGRDLAKATELAGVLAASIR